MEITKEPVTTVVELTSVWGLNVPAAAVCSVPFPQRGVHLHQPGGAPA